MGNYKLIKLSDEPYNFLVIATSYVSPLESAEKIIDKINLDTVNLIFDLTLINGTKFNRYIEMKYSKDIGKPDFSIANIIPNSIKAISCKYFMSHSTEVNNGVIPNALKYLLKNECV